MISFLSDNIKRKADNTKSFRLLCSVIIIFSSFCFQIQSEVYKWTGANIDYPFSWQEKTNWVLDSGGSDANNYPTDGDVAIFPDTLNSDIQISNVSLCSENATITIVNKAKNTVTLNIPDENYGTVNFVGNITVNNGSPSTTYEQINVKCEEAYYLEDDFTVTLSGEKFIVVESIEISRASKTDGIIGTLSIDAELECYGDIITHSGINLLFKKQSTLGNLIHDAWSSVPPSSINVNSNSVYVMNTLKLSQSRDNDSQKNGIKLIIKENRNFSAKNIELPESYLNNGETNAIEVEKNGTLYVIETLNVGNGISVNFRGTETIETLTNAGEVTVLEGTVTVAEITNTGTINQNGGEITVSGTTTNANAITITSGKIELKEITNTGTIIETGSTTEVKVTNILTNTGKVEINDGTFVASTIGNEELGTINQNGGAITVSGTTENNGIISVDNSVLNIEGEYFGEGDILTSELKLTNNGKVIFKSDVDLEKTKITTDNTETTVELLLTNDSTKINVTEDSQVYNFICNPNDKKTIEIKKNSQLNVRNKLVLKNLNILSSPENNQWKVNCENSEVADIENISLKDCNNISSKNLTAKLSEDNGNNDNWNFLNVNYTWTGATSTNWSEKSNWSPSSVPGLGTIVEIPEGKLNYPVLESETSIGNTAEYEGIIKIDSEAELNLNGNNFTASEIINNGELDFAGAVRVDSKKITNNNILRLEGNEEILGEKLNDSQIPPVSVIEYYGAFTDDSVQKGWGKKYANLKFSNVNDSDVTQPIIITGNIDISTEKNVKISSEQNEIKGIITVNKVNDIVIKTKSPIENANIILANDVEITNTDTQNLKIEKAKDVILSSTQKIVADIKEANNVTTDTQDSQEIKILKANDVLMTAEKNILSVMQEVGSVTILNKEKLTVTVVNALNDVNITNTGMQPITIEKDITCSTLSIDAHDIEFSNEDTNVTEYNVNGNLIFNGKTIGISQSSQNLTKVNFTKNIEINGTEEKSFEFAEKNLVIGTSKENVFNLENEKLTINAKELIWNSKGNFSNSLQINNSELFKLNEDADLTFTNGDFLQTKSALGKIILAGGIITSANNKIYLKNDVELFGDGGSDNLMILGGSSGIIEVDSNLYINAKSSKVIKLNSDAIVKKNFSCFNGKIQLGENLSSLEIKKDLVLLNGKTSEMYKDAESEIDNLYLYNNSKREELGRKKANLDFPLELPSGLVIEQMPNSSVEFKSSFDTTTLKDKKIICEENLYINGLDLSGTGIWELVIPDNSVSNTSFAEAYNSSFAFCKVSCIGDDGFAWISTENCIDNSNNSSDSASDFKCGIAFKKNKFKTNYVYTVFDDVIYVQFEDEYGNPRKIENSQNEINKAIKNIKFDNGRISFSGAYIDKDCTISTDDKGDLGEFYIATAGTIDERWNTDATGKSAGDANSTDRGRYSNDDSQLPVHKNIIPNIEFIKASKDVYDVLRDEYKNRLNDYSEENRYKNVIDKCSPVLIQVNVGQEFHSDYKGTAESQQEYDAHNYIEFVYSEKVDIGKLSATEDGIKNIQAIETFDSEEQYGGHIKELSSDGLEIIGYAKIEKGRLDSSLKIGSGSPHSLYRYYSKEDNEQSLANNPNSIRISVAGFVDGTVNRTFNAELKPFNNWVGYIDNAETPSGIITRIENLYIKDLSVDNDGERLFNCLTTKDFDSKTDCIKRRLPVLKVNQQKTQELKWDCLEPVFTPFIIGESESSAHNSWKEWVSNDYQTDVYEMVGAVNSDANIYLDNIEVHLFDNKPSNESWWWTRNGWNDNRIIPDTNGGAFNKRNLGGIRQSSLVEGNKGFSYYYDDSNSRSVGSKEITSFIKSSLFKSVEDSNTSVDGLYLTLPLNESDAGKLSVKEQFTVSYDNKNSYITDLAGNRLKSKSNMKTVDTIQPSFIMNLAPIQENLIYIMFSKSLNIPNDKEEFAKNLNSSLKFLDKSNNEVDIEIENVQLISKKEVYTQLLLEINRKLTLEDIKNIKICAVGDETSPKVNNLFGQGVYNTYIVDDFGNYIENKKSHAISDFALNAVDVLYARTGGEDDENNWDEKGIYGTNINQHASDYTVHDFSENGGNYGSIRADKDIILQVSFIPTGNETIQLVMDKKSNIDSNCISDKLNRQTGSNLRIWLDKPLDSLATEANDSPLDRIFPVDDSDLPKNLYNFIIPNGKSENSYNIKAGDELQFIFKICDSSGVPITIDHDGDTFTEEIPLYSLWMPNSAKILKSGIPFIDLWSITFKDIEKQRGGVSILNNVINVNVREETVIEVDMKKDGNLSVYVMTLDGNIIKKLSHGRKTAGIHYFKWNGTNNAKNSVARGLYFVRVIGPGIDETRKVMCVKE